VSETPDELRARLSALAEAATAQPWEVQTHWDVQNGDQGDDRFEDFESAAPFSLIRCLGASIEDTIAEVWGTEHDDVANAALIVALVNAWPEIDNLLARLATAEAELAALRSCTGAWDCTANAHIDACYSIGTTYDTPPTAEAVARREQP
jgi:hypothetical protein